MDSLLPKHTPAGHFLPGEGVRAMIMAAGLGTRLKPWTDKHPKALAVVNGKSLLQRNIEYLASYGINQVVVNIHHFADQIVDAVEKNNGWGSQVLFSDERDEVLETGGGLKKAAPMLSKTDPIVILNADILTDLNLHDMLRFHQVHDPLATLAVSNRVSSRYFLFDEHQKLCGWKNDKTGEQRGKDGSAAAFSGLHIISPKLPGLITEEGKFSLVDVYLRLATHHSILAYPHNRSKFIDVGKPESLSIAASMFP
ncbi:MAG TPA: nucleotidyltransferase [Chitinophagaceae bacterium]|nr:nucleotidyltransferase [Chitinophagaceae bacterium]HCY90084.1 nucleotidyltransferase [Chitinophagaceae bacterium]HRF26897.1 nucleotidyltransferase family protein [Ferruginibacter sp.]